MPIKSLPKKTQDKILGNGVVAPSFKEKLSTACRSNINTSKNTRLGSCLNDLLPTGSTHPCMARSFRRFRLSKVAFIGDIAKFFNSVYLSQESMPYSLLVMRLPSGTKNDPPETYVTTRLMYGIECSTTIAPTALQILMEEELKECKCQGQENLALTCQGMAHLLNDVISTIYVDDLFNGQKNLQKAKDLMDYIDRTLEKYGFKIKGWTYTGQPYSTDDPVRDENGMVTTALRMTPGNTNQQKYTMEGNKEAWSLKRKTTTTLKGKPDSKTNQQPSDQKTSDSQMDSPERNL